MSHSLCSIINTCENAHMVLLASEEVGRAIMKMVCRPTYAFLYIYWYIGILYKWYIVFNA